MDPGSYIVNSALISKLPKWMIVVVVSAYRWTKYYIKKRIGQFVSVGMSRSPSHHQLIQLIHGTVTSK